MIVELHFNHDSKSYMASRGEMNSGEAQFYIKGIDEDGNLGKREENPDGFINSILPKELKDWFFYFAENSKNSMSNANTINDLINLSGDSKTFKNALRKIQGFTKIDRLIQDLSEIEKQKKIDIDKASKNQEISDIAHKLEEHEEERDKLIIKKNIADSDKKDKDDGLKNITEKLQAQPKVKEMAAERERVKRLTKADQNTLKTLEEALQSYQADMLSKFTLYNVFSKSNSPEDKKEQETVILPFPQDHQTYTKLMEKRICICGRPIEKGSKAEIEIEKLNTDGVNPANKYNDRVSQILGNIQDIKNQCQNYPNILNKQNTAIEELNKKIEENKKKERELTSQINQAGNAESTINRLEKLYEQVNTQRDALLNSRGILINKIESKSREINELENQRAKVVGEKQITEKSTGLVKKLAKILDYTKQKLADDEKKAHTLITLEINKALKKYAYSNVQAIIDPETYKVTLMESGVDVPQRKAKSGGEDELLKYFFIASVIGLANKKQQHSLKYLTPPTSCPLVIDAPFTGMGKDFIKGTIDVMTEQVEQIIFIGLVDDFDDHFEKAIKKYIGKAYIIQKADKSEKSSSKEEPSKQKIFGKEYDFVLYGNNDENGKPVSQSKILEI
jgi:DNA sulfur modification protein DndD